MCTTKEQQQVGRPSSPSASTSSTGSSSPWCTISIRSSPVYVDGFGFALHRRRSKKVFNRKRSPTVDQIKESAAETRSTPNCRGQRRSRNCPGTPYAGPRGRSEGEEERGQKRCAKIPCSQRATIQSSPVDPGREKRRREEECRRHYYPNTRTSTNDHLPAARRRRPRLFHLRGQAPRPN